MLFLSGFLAKEEKDKLKRCREILSEKIDKTVRINEVPFEKAMKVYRSVIKLKYHYIWSFNAN